MMPNCIDLMQNNTTQVQNNFAVNYTDIQFEPILDSVNFVEHLRHLFANCFLVHCDMTSRERNSRYTSRYL